MDKVKPYVFVMKGERLQMPYVGIVQSEENGRYVISIGDDIKGLRVGSLLALRLPNGLPNLVFVAKVDKFIDRPAGIRRAVMAQVRGVWYSRFNSPQQSKKPLENVYVSQLVYDGTVMNAAEYKSGHSKYVEEMLKLNNHPRYMPLKAYAFWITGVARKMLDKRINFSENWVAARKAYKWEETI